MKRSRKDLLKSISKFAEEESTPVVLASNIIPKKEPKVKKKKEPQFTDPDTWFNHIVDKSNVKVSGKGRSDLFGSPMEKKKKKKNKNGVALTDFEKEFSLEFKLYHNLLQDNSRYIDQLQKQYDHMTGTKSTSRGISKTTTDLGAVINSARSLSAGIIDKTVSLKKTIQDLHMKEIKEYGVGKAESDIDVGNSAAMTLQNLINQRDELLSSNSGSYEIYDADDEDGIVSALSDSLFGDDIDEATNMYLAHEKDNVKIHVSMNENDYEDYDYVAVAEDGSIIDGYPLPEKIGSLKVNTSTLTATDTYGRKYRIDFR